MQVCSDDPGMPTAAEVDGDEDSSAPQCLPNQSMYLNVSADTNWVTLHPGLRFPDVQVHKPTPQPQHLSETSSYAIQHGSSKFRWLRAEGAYQKP